MLKNKIEKDYIEAYKSKNNFMVSVLRIIRSSIQNAEIEKKQELSDPEIVQLLRKEVKTRKDTKETYLAANRTEAADQEQKEIDFIALYLPKQLNSVETSQIVAKTITELGATNINQTGQIIGSILKKYGDSVEGALVAQIVKETFIK